MTDPLDQTISEEMRQFLPIFMDETDEHLDGLTEALLVLERDPGSEADLNEAFRLFHSIKGSAGLMGFEGITSLTHHLESRFELYRSGTQVLDRSTMDVVLRCIDYLRTCLRRLRDGAPFDGPAELLRDVESLAAVDSASAPAAPAAEAPAALIVDEETVPERIPDGRLVTVRFEPDLPLADLKARLVLTRVAAVGTVRWTRPSVDELDRIGAVTTLEIVVALPVDDARLREAADADGVASVELGGDSAPPVPEVSPADDSEKRAAPETPAARPRASETMRVDVDRLDKLMNLAGELVINRARFEQLAGSVAPAFGRRNLTPRMREFGDGLRRLIEQMRAGDRPGSTADAEQLAEGLEMLDEQVAVWEDGRRGFAQMSEAIDQLSRIAGSLQQGVLDTRMVPVAPLFNRFKRVVRDLSTERGKQVDLVIRGEKTELDKRMIDDLGDPLVHLIRNAIDHGLEAPDVRLARGKPGTGTIALEASHSGNNVFIHVRDDGGGLDLARIRAKIVERGLVGAAAADELSDDQVAEYIWHPGFSTAARVTDVSGRGVGMDAVKTRITDLNGQVDVETKPEAGTTFTIRLPLTLAIINSLLIRVRNIVFAMPIDDVREIVSVPARDVVRVHGGDVLDVRGEYIPLIGIDDVFEWSDLGGVPDAPASSNGHVDAVILQAGSRVMGLRVDELLGSQDIVIKSFAENFVHIRGLSGASILGDGGVGLMLDVATILDLAAGGAAGRRDRSDAP